MIILFVNMVEFSRNVVCVITSVFQMTTAAGEIQCAVLAPIFQAACQKLEGQARTGTLIK